MKVVLICAGLLRSIPLCARSAAQVAQLDAADAVVALLADVDAAAQRVDRERAQRVQRFRGVFRPPGCRKRKPTFLGVFGSLAAGRGWLLAA